MASHFMISTCNTLTVVLLLLTFSSLQIFHVSSFEFTVGDTTGWVVPPSNDTKMYNDWASENRFQVGDSIHFKYRKDSVMEVSEAEYKKCNSTHPNFFSNTGNTVFELDRSGAFYFISGAAGHCTRGQRMIIKVMSPEDSRGGNSTSGAALLLSNGLVLKLVFIQFLLSYVASCLL